MLERTKDAGPRISEADIARFERDEKLVLPVDYRRFLLAFNGGRPVPADFMLSLEDEPMHWRLHFFFGLDHPVGSNCLPWRMGVTAETRPAGTLPIASDEGGNMIYLRHSAPDAGSVHFGPTPSNGRRVQLTRICGSFTEFLEQLREIPL